MPYIKQEERKALADGEEPKTVGQLNYLITLDILACRAEQLSLEALRAIILQRAIDFVNPVRSYTNFNEIVGVITCASLEYARRVKDVNDRDFQIVFMIREAMTTFYKLYVAPYENKKKEENGDVF